MSTETSIRVTTTVTWAARNVALGLAFTRSLLDDPVTLHSIPCGATLVLIPDDDPDLARHNAELGVGLIGEGKDVYVRRVRIAELPATGQSATGATLKFEPGEPR